jgi:serine/threonine protein kinase
MFSPFYIKDGATRLTYLRTAYKGTYGHIDLARYETAEETTEVYVKRPIHQGNSLIHEACVKMVVREFLAGIEGGAPRIVRIFRLRDGSVCFAMEQIEGSVTLSEFLGARVAQDATAFSQIIMDCLFQLCGMMWHLENRLGLNHRDLTPGNFLVVEHPPRQKVISVGAEVFEITSTHSLTLIDFGFSCIGSVETQVAELALSEMYHEKDPCPKTGRDLFLFLGLVYVTYYARMPPTMRELFEGWIHNEGLCRFLRKDAENAQHWLYFMIRDTGVRRFHCTAEQVVADLMRAERT